MKRFMFIMAVILNGFQMTAQAPQRMSYQAVIRNNIGDLVRNIQIRIRIQILKGIESDTIVFEETHEPMTNDNGLATIQIGNGNLVSGSFSGIQWNSGPFFLKTDIDPEGGFEYSISGTTQIISVPYALYAEKSGNGFSGNYNDLTHIPDQIDLDMNDDVKLTGSQEIHGNKIFMDTLNMNDKRILQLGVAHDKSDAANKGMVDELMIRILALENLVFQYGTVTDYEGNQYKTIKIGNQEWMAENLKSKLDRNGNPIYYPSAIDPVYVSKYGMMYSAYSTFVEVCPEGWHRPSDLDWQKLELYLGMDSLSVKSDVMPRGNDEAVKLKSLGFNLLYAGEVSPYHHVPMWTGGVPTGETTIFYCTDTTDPHIWRVFYRKFSIYSEQIKRGWIRQGADIREPHGSVRCLKD